ncbi:WXG100 family type VII secretion target [Kitasatospora sp. NPDC004240]
MAGQFKMTAEEMNGFAKHMGEVIQQIQGEIRRLDSLVGSVAAGWQGTAATAYKALQTRFNEDAVELNKSLTAIKEAIELTTKHYSVTEAEQQAAFKS